MQFLFLFGILYGWHALQVMIQRLHYPFWFHDDLDAVTSGPRHHFGNRCCHWHGLWRLDSFSFLIGPYTTRVLSRLYHCSNFGISFPLRFTRVGSCCAFRPLTKSDSAASSDVPLCTKAFNLSWLSFWMMTRSAALTAHDLRSQCETRIFNVYFRCFWAMLYLPWLPCFYFLRYTLIGARFTLSTL